jgi:hypothetical protein
MADSDFLGHMFLQLDYSTVVLKETGNLFYHLYIHLSLFKIMEEPLVRDIIEYTKYIQRENGHNPGLSIFILCGMDSL